MRSVLVILLFLSSVLGTAQDTLAYGQLVDTTGQRTGAYVIEGPLESVFNGERWVLERAPWYQMGQYSLGSREGLWRVYRRGLSTDTLLREVTYMHDTVEVVVEYSSSRIATMRESYVKGEMINMIGYYRTGEKRFEQSCITCARLYLDGQELHSDFYKNGIVRSVGVQVGSSTRKTTGYVRMKGMWLYFTDKGELHHRERYWMGLRIGRRCYPTVGGYEELLSF